MDDDGTRVPLDVKEGDEVLYSRHRGTEIKVDGEDLLVLRASDILDEAAIAGLGDSAVTASGVADDASQRLAELKRGIETNIAQLHQLAK
jgi:hypothetical protein